MAIFPLGSAKSTSASILFSPRYLSHAPGDRLARARNVPPHHWDWWKSDLLPRLPTSSGRDGTRDDLASRLLAEADPTRGLDCGSDRGNT